MSLVTADKVDRYDDLQLPVHLQVRTRFSSATEGVAETLSIFARVQAAFSIVGIVIFFSLAAHQGERRPLSSRSMKDLGFMRCESASARR